MRSIFCAIYHSSSPTILLNTLLIEATLNGSVTFKNKKVELNNKNSLSEIEKTVLKKIVLNKKSNIKLKHFEKLKEEYLSMCFKESYLNEFLFFGIKKTRKFKKDVRDNIDSIDEKLVAYIKDGNLIHLKEIIPEIENINYPKFKTFNVRKDEYNADSAAIQGQAMVHHITQGGGQ